MTESHAGPEIGTVTACPNCGREVVVTSHASYENGPRKTFAHHVDTADFACDVPAWDAAETAADYTGGFAVWVL